MNSDVNSLAIVIPAYKKLYFEKTLNSLSNQSNKNFTVYIGDDNSPDDLEHISKKFANSLKIIYRKFDRNIGGRKLVEQWRRCVNLIQEERWIWLFSDDDIADETCVEAFFSLLDSEESHSDVYRFNTCIIDRHGDFVRDMPLGPAIENAEEMAIGLLLAQRGNSMPDHIFSTKTFKELGGFVYTDYAQGADWATSIRYAATKGMRIIPNSKIKWRYSGDNISSLASKNRSKTIPGHLQFITWVLAFFEYLKIQPTTVSFREIEQAALNNLDTVLRWHYKGIPKVLFIKMIFFLKKEFQMNYLEALKFIWSVNNYTKNPKVILKRIFSK